LLAHRVRQATKKGAELNIIHAVDDDLLMRVANKAIVAPALLPQALAQVVKAAAELKNVAIPDAVSGAVAAVTADDVAKRIAASLIAGQKAGVFIGNFAEQHAAAGTLHALAQALAAIIGCPMGVLGAAANSVGGYVAGCVPTGKVSGVNARQMIETPLKAYLLLGVEPELDLRNPRQAVAAMRAAELVVALSPFQHGAAEYANVMLPVSPFTETAGTFVSTEGRAQTFTGVVKPLGETRPAWKVLRVLGNLLGLSGFEHDSAEDAQREALHGKSEIFNKNNNLNVTVGALPGTATGIVRIAETAIYGADALTRRASSLQLTRDALPPVAMMNRALADKLGLRDGDALRVVQDGGDAVVPYGIDDKLPADCVRLSAARCETAMLGAADAPLVLERVVQAQKASA
jgi:NADH-quinone oxidoreductase subunit G